MNSIPPPADNYPEVLAAVIDAVLKESAGAGVPLVEKIDYPRRDVAKRPGLSRKVAAEVFNRDHFICRYCGGQLILTPIMELISNLYPEMFPFHPNWKTGQTHPAILSRSPVVDHVAPGSMGGDWSDVENMVTACWLCNGRKANYTLSQMGWEVLPIAGQDAWDGLTAHYPALWEAAGRPKPQYHQGWIVALGLAVP